MRNYIKVSLLLLLVFGVSSFVSSTYYVTDPANCPTSYQSQTCSGSDVVCGYSGGVTFCYDPTNINPPTVDVSTTGTGGTDYSCSDTTCSGGFIIDCHYYDGSAPHCDNGNTGFCDRNPTCYNKHVQTTCTQNVFVTSSCSATCTTNYFQCDGDTTDADGCEIQAGASCGSGTGTIVNGQCYSSSAGNCTSSTRLDCDNSDSDGDVRTCNVGNGCEITIGGACSVGALSGVYGSTCTGSSGTCLVTPQFFKTGIKAEGQSNATNPFLYGLDYNIGTLLNLSWSVGGGFMINGTGLYFNSTLIEGGSAETDPLAYNGTLMRIDQWNATNTTYLRIDQWNATNTSYLRTDQWNATNTTYAINQTLADMWALFLGATNTSYYLKENPFGFWNNTFATFNKTYADGLYFGIGNWNATNTSYLRIDQWNSTNTTYLRIDQWNATNTTYLRIDQWNATNSSYRLNDNQTWVGNLNVTGNTNTTISFIRDSGGACPTAVSGAICRNSTGVYIVG